MTTNTNHLTTVHVYDAYEGQPFNQAYASFDYLGYDGANVEHTTVQIEIPDCYQLVKNDYGTTLLAHDGGEYSAEPIPSVDVSGHFTGKSIRFIFGFDDSLTCPIVQPND